MRVELDEIGGSDVVAGVAVADVAVEDYFKAFHIGGGYWKEVGAELYGLEYEVLVAPAHTAADAAVECGMGIGGVLRGDEAEVAIREWGELEAKELEFEVKFGFELYAEALGAVSRI